MDNSTMEEYSSGCESGWTVYFEQSRGYVDDQGCVNRSEAEEEEEEDLSMVSDASSGPAQVSQDNNNTTNGNCYINGEMMFYSVSTDEDAALVRNKQRIRRSKRIDHQEKGELGQCHMLDDTASSRPDFNYSSMNNDDQAALDFSQDHISTSYFQSSGASSSAMHSHHYDQLQFQQQYNWY